MRITRCVDRTGDFALVAGKSRLDFLGFCARQHVLLESECIFPRDGRLGRGKAALIRIEMQLSRKPVVEGKIGFRQQQCEFAARLSGEFQNGACIAPPSRKWCVGEEAQSPEKKIRVELPANPERGIAAESNGRQMPEQSGRCHRIAIGPGELRGVAAAGAAAGFGCCIDKRHIMPCLGQKVGRGNADHAGADDRDLRHVTPRFPQARSARSRPKRPAEEMTRRSQCGHAPTDPERDRAAARTRRRRPRRGG